MQWTGWIDPVDIECGGWFGERKIGYRIGWTEWANWWCTVRARWHAQRWAHRQRMNNRCCSSRNCSICVYNGCTTAKCAIRVSHWFVFHGANETGGLCDCINFIRNHVTANKTMSTVWFDRIFISDEWSTIFIAVAVATAAHSTCTCSIFIVRQIMQEMATWSIWAQANAVKCATIFGFVFRMTLYVTQFILAMGKLAFFAVFAFARLLEWAAQFGLVSVKGTEGVG